MAEQGTHFWLIAFISDCRHLSASGTLTPKPGATRLDMYNLIRDDLVARTPGLRDASVIAFDIQPNKL